MSLKEAQTALISPDAPELKKETPIEQLIPVIGKNTFSRRVRNQEIKNLHEKIQDINTIIKVVRDIYCHQCRYKVENTDMRERREKKEQAKKDRIQ